MKETLTDQQSKAIIKALDDAIESGPWDQSNFLRAVGKNLNEIRDNFVNQMRVRTPAQLKAESHFANRMALRSGQLELFISLYSTDGSNIQSWERIVANLPRQMISRPIYSNEGDITALLKSKENKQNEAYVAIYVNKTDVLPCAPDKVVLDKLGHQLLNLKDKSLDLENITRFVHVSGVYRYERGRLLKD